MPDMIITAQQHILHQQQGTFSRRRRHIFVATFRHTLATKMIQAKIRQAGLLDVLGSAGETNVQGETQQKLDVYANQALLHCLGLRDTVAILVSEENEEPVRFAALWKRANTSSSLILSMDLRTSM